MDQHAVYTNVYPGSTHAAILHLSRQGAIGVYRATGHLFHELADVSVHTASIGTKLGSQELAARNNDNLLNLVLCYMLIAFRFLNSEDSGQQDTREDEQAM
jgi:hypothetical protein